MLIFATDDIEGAFDGGVVVTGGCEEIAGRVPRDLGRATDEALVVVGRYMGKGR